MTIYSKQYQEVLKRQICILETQKELIDNQATEKALSSYEYNNSIEMLQEEYNQLEVDLQGLYVSRHYINNKPIG